MLYIKRQGRIRATKTIVDGIKFDSKREATRYLELKELERAGLIQDLKLQVPYELQPKFKLNGKTYRPITYIADFVYIQDGEEVIEDSKGFKTNEYKLKAKLFAFKYGKQILET